MENKIYIVLLYFFFSVDTFAQMANSASRIDFEYDSNGSLSRKVSICDSTYCHEEENAKGCIKAEKKYYPNIEIIKTYENYRLKFRLNGVSERKNCTLIVSSVSGVVYCRKVGVLSNLNFDFDDLPRGNYIITFIIDGKLETIKFTKS